MKKKHESEGERSFALGLQSLSSVRCERKTYVLMTFIYPNSWHTLVCVG